MNEDKLYSSEEAGLPEIDCVIIGVNCQQTLSRCLTSVQESNYPGEKIHIFYVDGGSSDKSLEIAESFDGVESKVLDLEYPTPGIGRNQGFRMGSSPLVQFLDSDTILDPDWLSMGVKAMEASETGAVQGRRLEMHPERSVFNWIGSLEWNGPEGQADSFGGDVMIRRDVLEKTGGYDEILVGGEDPELSRRVTREGWIILQLGETMTLHDLAMTKISQYLKRAYRSGYGFAAVRYREARQDSIFWRHQILKIVFRGGGFIGLNLLGAGLLSFDFPGSKIAGILCLIAGFGGLFRPRLFLVHKFMKQHDLTRKQGRVYAWHCSIVVIPQFLGVLRYHIGRYLNRPLLNRRRQLATAVTGK